MVLISSNKLYYDGQVQVACTPDQWRSQGWKIGGAKRSPTVEGPGLYPREMFANQTLKNLEKTPHFANAFGEVISFLRGNG